MANCTMREVMGARRSAASCEKTEQGNGAELYQGGIFASQDADDLGSSFSGNLYTVDDVFGRPGMGNGNHHILGRKQRGRHDLHVRVVVGNARESEAKELVVGIPGHDGGPPDTVEFDAPGRQQGLYGRLQVVQIELVQGVGDGFAVGVQDLAHDFRQGVFLARHFRKCIGPKADPGRD